MDQIAKLYRKTKRWILRHKRELGYGGAIAVVVLVTVQLFYPADRMLPFSSVGGTKVGLWLKEDAAKKLEAQLATKSLKVYIGNSDTPYANVLPKDIGVEMSLDKNMDSADYPWYMRLVPSSIVWYRLLQRAPTINYQHDEKVAQKFLESDLASSCVLPAKDASLKFNGKDFDIVSAREGGTCNKSDALAALNSAKPAFSGNTKVRIPAEVTQPKVRDTEAQDLAKQLLGNSKGGIKIVVGKDTQTIPQNDVLSWLTFSTKSAKLEFEVDVKKSDDYISKNITPKVTKASGTTRIGTRDFTVLSKQVGATGQTLNVTETLTSMKGVLKGEASIAKAAVAPLKPKVVYNRSYTSTSTGIAALITHYDDEHAGDFGVAFSELGGQARSAMYQSTRQFTTASTYKLFVAYGTLKNVDSGKWKWSMQVNGGRDLTKCFDDMIVKSDNACAEALLKKLGYSKLTNDIRELGLSRSGFITGDTPLTTAGDLSLFLTKLQNNTLGIKSSSRTTLINAMKRNVYRQGIPAGTSATVADKVGFLNALVHDAAIVYSSKGTYVLTIMTDGSSWANVAELTRKIEALR